MAFAGLAPSISILITSPVDLVKARIQASGEGGLAANTRGMLARIATNEGLPGLYRGLGVSMLREASLNTMRLGLYDPVMSQLHAGYKDMASSKDTGVPPLHKRLLCGSLCGIIGSAAANPMELIKCRIQCAGHHTYANGFEALREIVKHEGLRGLWNGAGVFALRNAIGSAANLSTFSALKAYGMRHRRDCPPVLVDILSGLGSGVVTTIVMCPVDMVKTRLQNQPVDPISGVGTLYRNPWHATTKIVHTEGISSLYKGFTWLFVRTGPHYVLTFTIFGILKRGWAGGFDDSVAEDLQVQ